MTMPSISFFSLRGPIAGAREKSAGWTGTSADCPAAVYLSAGDNTRLLSVTHPDHIRSRIEGGQGPEPFAFYVHVDEYVPQGAPELDYRDDRTRIECHGCERLNVGPHPAWLMKLSIISNIYGERNVAVLRVRASNAQFTRQALAENWKTHCLITVLDGCTGFGRPLRRSQNRCEVEITGRRRTNLLKLKPDWLITDHFNGPWPWHPHDLRPGEIVEPDDPKRFGLRFKHAGALATPQWPGAGQGDKQRYIRLYEVGPTENWVQKETRGG